MNNRDRKPPLGNVCFLIWQDLAMRCSVPFQFITALAIEFGAVDCFWRESERSFTGYVAEVWFEQMPSDFAVRWAAVVGSAIRVRCATAGPSRFTASVPCLP
jgi:hypothetical protein